MWERSKFESKKHKFKIHLGLFSVKSKLDIFESRLLCVRAEPLRGRWTDYLPHT